MPKLAYRRIVWDLETLQVIECDAYLYDGPWEELKGGQSKAEEARANALSQQQINIQNQQLAMQQKQLGMVNPSLQAIIQNGGMLPAQEAAMRSQALNGLGQQYQNLYGNLSQTLAARGITGGQNAGAGALAQSYGSLGAQEAGQQSELLNQIQLAKGQNLMGALQTGLGEGQMYGQQALGFGGQGVNALGIGQQAAGQADQASSSFWGSLVGGLAGMGSSYLRGGLVGCWVAAELYGGWLTPETVAIRNWLTVTWYMAPFLALYLRIGKRWAAAIQTNPCLRVFTKRLFDLFLRAARA